MRTKGKGTVYVRSMGEAQYGDTHDEFSGRIEIGGGRVTVTVPEATTYCTYGDGTQFDFPAGWCAVRWEAAPKRRAKGPIPIT